MPHLSTHIIFSRKIAINPDAISEGISELSKIASLTYLLAAGLSSDLCIPTVGGEVPIGEKARPCKNPLLGLSSNYCIVIQQCQKRSHMAIVVRALHTRCYHLDHLLQERKFTIAKPVESLFVYNRTPGSGKGLRIPHDSFLIPICHLPHQKQGMNLKYSLFVRKLCCKKNAFIFAIGQKRPQRRRSVQPKPPTQYKVDTADANFSSSQQMHHDMQQGMHVVKWKHFGDDYDS